MTTVPSHNASSPFRVLASKSYSDFSSPAYYSELISAWCFNIYYPHSEMAHVINCEYTT